MKSLTLACAILLAGAPVALAQSGARPPSPLNRFEIGGTLGWFNANKSNLESDSYNDWYNDSLHGGLSAAWYWTDHLKTEVEVGGTTESKLRTYPRVVVNGLPANTPIEHSFSTRKLAVGQYYQGYRNVWFHPYVAAGVEATWERSHERHAATYFFDSAARTSREVLPARTVGPDTDVVVRPFGAVGFKAYMTPRSFFKSDLRLAVRGGVDEVVVRFGFGVDF